MEYVTRECRKMPGQATRWVGTCWSATYRICLTLPPGRANLGG